MVVAQGKAFGYIPVYVQTSFQIITNGAGTGQVRATVTGKISHLKQFINLISNSIHTSIKKKFSKFSLFLMY